MPPPIPPARASRPNLPSNNDTNIPSTHPNSPHNPSHRSNQPNLPLERILPLATPRTTLPQQANPLRDPTTDRPSLHNRLNLHHIRHLRQRLRLHPQIHLPKPRPPPEIPLQLNRKPHHPLHRTFPRSRRRHWIRIQNSPELPLAIHFQWSDISGS